MQLSYNECIKFMFENRKKDEEIISVLRIKQKSFVDTHYKRDIEFIKEHIKTKTPVFTDSFSPVFGLCTSLNAEKHL